MSSRAIRGPLTCNIERRMSNTIDTTLTVSLPRKKNYLETLCAPEFVISESTSFLLDAYYIDRDPLGSKTAETAQPQGAQSCQKKTSLASLEHMEHGTAFVEIFSNINLGGGFMFLFRFSPPYLANY